MQFILLLFLLQKFMFYESTLFKTLEIANKSTDNPLFHKSYNAFITNKIRYAFIYFVFLEKHKTKKNAI